MTTVPDLVDRVHKTMVNTLPKATLTTVYVVAAGAICAIGAYFVTMHFEVDQRLIKKERELLKAQQSITTIIQQAGEEQLNRLKSMMELERNTNQSRLSVFTDYSEKFNSVSESSLATSKRLQELVSGQIDNMKKLELQSANQSTDATRRLEAQEALLRSEIQRLEEQRSEAQKTRNELARQTTAQFYLGISSLIDKQLAQTGGSFNLEPILNLLRHGVDNADLASLIESERVNPRTHWKKKLLLNYDKFLVTKEVALLKESIGLVELNADNSDSDVVYILGLFSRAHGALVAGILQNFYLSILIGDTRLSIPEIPLIYALNADRQTLLVLQQLSPERKIALASLIMNTMYSGKAFITAATEKSIAGGIWGTVGSGVGVVGTAGWSSSPTVIYTQKGAKEQVCLHSLDIMKELSKDAAIVLADSYHETSWKSEDDKSTPTIIDSCTTSWLAKNGLPRVATYQQKIDWVPKRNQY